MLPHLAAAGLADAAAEWGDRCWRISQVLQDEAQEPANSHQPARRWNRQKVAVILR
jgi:hypothetical protein